MSSGSAHTHRHLARIDHVHSPKITTGEVDGPASYATGGFELDLTDEVVSLQFVSLAIETVGPNLPPAHYEITINDPDSGIATIKVMRHRYDKLTSVDDVSGQPGGVTVQAASGATTSTSNEDVSTTGAAATVDAGAGSGAAQNEAHTHSHSHTFDSIYEHGHDVTQTETDAESVELAATTDLSGTTWRYFAVGLTQ